MTLPAAEGRSQTPLPVHPHIAEFPGGAPTPPEHVREPGPMFQFADGIWNHGEGFGSNPIDTGGWHGFDDGAGVTWADVHNYTAAPGAPVGWHAHTWTDRFHAAGQGAGQSMLRWVGYLRPAGIPLQDHPEFGNPNSTADPPWVDNAAFEVFCPDAAPLAGQQVVLVVALPGTQSFPGKIVDPGPPVQRKSYDWRLRYPGWFSPDGLPRAESTTGYATNLAADDVSRPPSASIIGLWKHLGGQGVAPSYWPVVMVPVQPVIHRPTSLGMQRCLQVLRGVELLLANAPPPVLAPQSGPLPVVWAGGSNGGLLSQWAVLLHPDRAQAAFCTVLNPSIQRLLSEQEAAYSLAAASGFFESGAIFGPIDMRNWDHYPRIFARELRDLSLLRQNLLGNVGRPAVCQVGDEDITSTGTDWIRLLANSAGFVPQGGVVSGSPFLAWMSSEKRCHGNGAVVNPFTGLWTANHYDVLHDLLDEVAVNWTVPPPAAPPPVPALPLLDDARDPDDPTEWVWARLWQQQPPSSSVLVEDQAFYSAAQPGAAGTALGSQEAIAIRNHKVYVGSAEGVVSAFDVDVTAPELPLRRVAQSPPLGHQAWGLAFLDNGDLVVGTRRHLHRLNGATLAPAGAPLELLWRQARPHRLQVKELCTASAGREILLTSVHGAVLLCDQNLAAILLDWREPGVKDLVLPSVSYPLATTSSNDAVTLLSERGVIANVTLGTDTEPRPAELHASSVGQEGTPIDLELQLFGSGERVVAVYGGDDKGVSLRFFDAANLDLLQEVTNIGDGEQGQSKVIDLAMVHLNTETEMPGDHLLLLKNDWLYLFDQFGVLLAKKSLADIATGYLPAVQSNAIAVGDLVPGLPSEGTYDEEVVVATVSGRLVWFHVDEILAGGVNDIALPVTHQDLIPGSAIQPRTNQALSCTWPIAAATDGMARLEVLEQNGMMWEVTPSGGATLKKWHVAAKGPNRGWVKVGFPGSIPNPPFRKVVRVSENPTDGFIRSIRYCPIGTGEARFQQTPYFASNNWNERDHRLRFLDDYAIFCRGGGVRSLAGGGFAAYWWSGSQTGRTGKEGPWANFVEGLRVDGSGNVTGAWASTGSSLDGNGNADYLDLRTVIFGLASMDLQGVEVVEDPRFSGEDLLVLGCPGGRVRIVKPGGLTEPHGFGSEVAASDDYGHGGAALAVRPASAPAQHVDIFFGTLYHHVPRGGYPTGALGDGEVQTGSIHWLRWDPATPSAVTHVSTLELPPVAGSDRGGFGVMGLCVADLLTDAGHPGEELIATTLEGDLYVLDIQGGTINQTPIYRAHVPGGLGLYDSIVVADLDGSTPGPELYLAGSLGIRRFTAPGNP